ncbi:unnamed protein product [Linum tenue]|uniref:Uncharacterized protein n=1 Tax=Linum tenue TaxID=586396 RepID=A0AAV0LKQ8_9ROSI|nr:unnamed protein product [Linum tenue]
MLESRARVRHLESGEEDLSQCELRLRLLLVAVEDLGGVLCHLLGDKSAFLMDNLQILFAVFMLVHLRASSLNPRDENHEGTLES